MAATKYPAIIIALALLVGANGTATGQSESPSSPPAVQGDAAQPPAQRVRVSEKVSQLFLAKKVQPQYPQDARDQHTQGMVVLKVAISKEGDVTNLMLVSGDPLLAPAAIAAVKQWKYKPYLLNRQPVALETQVSVSFELRSK
jgi:periplasmic protein TonB